MDYRITQELLQDISSKITPTVVALEIFRNVEETLRTGRVIPVYLNNYDNIVVSVIR